MKPDVIIGTESWLIPEHKVNGILSSEIFPEGYKASVARRDRQEIPAYSENDSIRGGGTFVLIKDDIIGVRQCDLETNCEIVWTKIEIPGSKSLYVASFYRPHESDRQSLEELQSSLGKICNQTTSHVWVGGDFNLPGYDWGKEFVKPGCSQPELTRKFLDIAAEHGLSQIVKEPTYYDNTLDLFLSNKPSLVQNCQVIPGISKDGHHAILLEIDIVVTRRPKRPRKIYAFKRANWTAIREHMTRIVGDIMASTNEETPVDSILDSFTNALKEAQDQFIPSKMSRPREQPPWITAEVRKLIRKQKKLFDRQKGCA